MHPVIKSPATRNLHPHTVDVTPRRSVCRHKALYKSSTHRGIRRSIKSTTAWQTKEAGPDAERGMKSGRRGQSGWLIRQWSRVATVPPSSALAVGKSPKWAQPEVMQVAASVRKACHSRKSFTASLHAAAVVLMSKTTAWPAQ